MSEWMSKGVRGNVCIAWNEWMDKCVRLYECVYEYAV